MITHDLILRGGTPDFKWWDDQRIFLIPGVFWVGKFGRYYLGGLILVEIFGGIQSNLKIHGSARISRLCATNTIIQFLIYFWCYIIILMLSGKFKGRGNQHGILGGVNFWSRDFLGFVGRPRDFAPHSIIPVIWNPEYPPWDLIHALPTLALEKLTNLFLYEFCVKTSCIKLFSSSAKFSFYGLSYCKGRSEFRIRFTLIFKLASKLSIVRIKNTRA